MDEPISFKHADEYSDRFTDLLQTALRDRLRTRRVGVLMSGGLDSTTLAAVAQSLLRDATSPLYADDADTLLGPALRRVTGALEP